MTLGPDGWGWVPRRSLAMAFRLLESARDRWRSINGSQLVALVRAGATFSKGGVLVEADVQDREVAA